MSNPKPRWIITIGDDPGYIIGPFDAFEKARAYRDADPEAEDMCIIKLTPPSRMNRKAAA